MQIDVLLDIFDFLLDLHIETEDVSLAEIIRGDAVQTTKLIRSIRRHFG